MPVRGYEIRVTPFLAVAFVMSLPLEHELRNLLVTRLELAGVKPDDIDPEAPLFGDGLGLDSIDALELAVAIERKFRVTIPDEAVGKKAFASVSALAGFVSANLAA